MQSLMAVVAKLIRVFYAMLTKGVEYDPAKMLGDIKRPTIILAGCKKGNNVGGCQVDSP